MSNSLTQDIFNLLMEAGGPLTLTHIVSGGVYDPTTGVSSAEVTANYTFTGALIQLSDLAGPRSLVVTNFRKVLISAQDLNITPLNEDKISNSSDTYTIKEVSTVTFGGTVVGYICKVEA